MSIVLSSYVFGNRSSETDQSVLSSGPSSITAVIAFSKGFACASGLSVVHLFEKGDDKECYRKTREIQVRALSSNLLESCKAALSFMLL